jgi:hypothetical protein
MHAAITLRALYLPAGTTIDLDSAKATVTGLCRAATLDDLHLLFREEWLDWDTLPGSQDWPHDWPEYLLPALAGVLRAGAEQTLHRRLDRLAASLHGRDVVRFRVGGDDGVDAYVTGGLDADDALTDAYDSWGVVVATDPARFPEGWAGQIGAAAGLLRPDGPGPAVRTVPVTFHRWA